jgi:hypothetical protein
VPRCSKAWATHSMLVQCCLLFVGELHQSLRAAVTIITHHPKLLVAIVTSTDVLASAALQGLVPIEAVEDRILATVVKAYHSFGAPMRA